MTRLDLQNYVLNSLVDDPLGGYFIPSTVVQPALNRGQEEVQKQLIMAGELYYLKEVQTSTVQNQADYIWPTDLLKIHRLELVLSGIAPNEVTQTLLPVTLNQINFFGPQTGTPSNYILKQDRFTLAPIPDVILTMHLYYSYKIAALTSDSQVPDIPEEYQKMIGVYAGIECKVKDNTDPSNLMQMKMDFENRMKQMAMDRQYQTPRMVRETDSQYEWISY